MICSEEAHSNDLYMDSSVSFAIGFTNFVEVMICSTEAHSVILLNTLYMDSSVSSGFAICGSDDNNYV